MTIPISATTLHVKYGFEPDTVTWAFTTFRDANWHPLTWLSHALDCHLYSLDAGKHHRTNVLLHAVNAVLLFWVLLQATGYVGRSAMVAALFALHPINVESVVWISERKNLLSMLFFLLALGAYRWYASKPRVGRYTVVALLYALGLMCKPQVITFPFVLLLWDYWPLQRMFATTAEFSDRPTAATGQEFLLAGGGEAAAVRAFRSERCHHHQSATDRRRHERAPEHLSISSAVGERHRFLRAIHRQSDLARHGLRSCILIRRSQRGKWPRHSCSWPS